MLTRPYPDRVRNIVDKYLSVADVSRTQPFRDRIGQLAGQFVFYHRLDFDFGEKIDVVNGPL